MSKKKKINRKIQLKILSIFKANPNKTFNYKQIAARLEFSDSNSRNLIIKSISKLCSKKILKQNSPGKYTLLNDNKTQIEGVLNINYSGNGYLLTSEEKEDIFIHRRNITYAFDGDYVKAYKFNGKNEGEIVEVLERKKQFFVGILERKKDFGFVNTKKSKVYTDFFIEQKELKDFKDGEKVVVEFKEWPKMASSPFGRIVKTLGLPGELNTEMNAIVSDYGLPEKFPDVVEKFTKNIVTKIDKNLIGKRKDFRKKTTFTIDPRSAKDFDDAISFTPLLGNKYEIGVHIADVSHYVEPNSVLDEEAYKRGTSVYLVDRVIPMLPELLSNEVCSLIPQKEKFTFSAVFVVNDKVEIEKEWFGKTIIYSDHRFSYEEVQYILESKDKNVSAEVSLTEKAYSISEEVFSALNTLNNYAKILRNKRISRGALTFEREEVSFNLDKEDNPESIFFKTPNDSNKLVEEFMLLANKRVAEFIGKQKQKREFVYRVHDLPDQEKLLNLKRIAKGLGYELNLQSKNINKSLNNLLKESHGKNEQDLIDTLTIRSMSKAEYNTKNIGHYGLAFDYYTHFTSPIRRYPDLLVHRLVESYTNNSYDSKGYKLDEICKHSSDREQLATKAERESIKYMQVKFMQDKIDQKFKGVISGVTERGIYVEILENKCEGFIKINEIKGDFFTYEEGKHRLIGEKSKVIYQLGAVLEIVVKKADVIKKQLDFVLSNSTE